MTMLQKLLRRLGWWKDPPPPPHLPERETLSCGPDPLQKLDVYRPPNAAPGAKLPVILMVHGGGWDNPDGDKANPGVIANKAAYYVPKGWIVVSMNYRLYPQVTPLEEQQDVAYAYAFVQKMKGVDPKRVGLMGHSAGAARVQQFGGMATVQQFDLSHADMDSQVGLPGPLTDAIDKFIGA